MMNPNNQPFPSNSRYQLLVTVDGVVKSVNNITPRMTCDDVIHALLTNAKHPTPHEALYSYALFENQHGVEHALKGRCNIMQLKAEWGENQNVQLTMRKIDSTIKDGVYGSTSKRKQKYKNWFKRSSKSNSDSSKKPAVWATKDLKPTGMAESVEGDIHDDSSIIMQNKENLLCAFNCYSRRKSSSSKGGLKQQNSNVIKAPFEGPLNVMTSFEKPKSITLQMMSKQQKSAPLPLPLPGECNPPQSVKHKPLPMPGDCQPPHPRAKQELTDTITCIYSNTPSSAMQNHPTQYSLNKRHSMASAQYTSAASASKSASIVQGLSASMKKDSGMYRGSTTSLSQSQTNSLKKDSVVYGKTSTGSLRKANNRSMSRSTASLRRAAGNVYGSGSIALKDSNSAYGSSMVTLNKSKSSVYGSASSLSNKQIYGSTTALPSDVIYHSKNDYHTSKTASLRKNTEHRSSSSCQQSAEPIYSTLNDAYTKEHVYDFLQPCNIRRSSLPQNPVDWDYDPPSDDTLEDSDSQTGSYEKCRSSKKGYYAEERFKNLLDVVLSQERRIQEQQHRIEKADEQIEHYEFKLHNSRSKEQGKDYLQDTYMKEALNENMVDHQDINLYETILENIGHMEEKIAKQYSKIDDLSTMIHSESQMQMNETDVTGVGPFESTRIDPSIQKQLDELRQQIQETVNMSLARDSEIKELDSCLSSYEQQMKEKENKLNGLLKELNSNQDKPSSVLVNRVQPLTVDDKLSKELHEKETKIRSIITSATKKPQVPNSAEYFNEMGVDVGVQKRTMQDSKISNPCDNEVEKILQCQQATPVRNKGQLTPVATPLGVSVNAIVEYHNETVDLDTLCNIGRHQNPSKLFNETHGFKPINQPVVTGNKLCPSSVKDDDLEVKLPLVGVESFAKVFSSKLMPDLTITDPENYRLTMVDNDMDSDLDTTIWNTQDDFIDVTFPIPQESKVVPGENTYFNSPNKTYAVLESTANNTECGESMSTVSVSAATNCNITNTVMAALPPKHNSSHTALQKTRAKKKLFQESTTPCNDILQQQIRDMTSSVVTGSNHSRLSDSSESGVGSPSSAGEEAVNHSDVSSDSAVSSSCGTTSFVETTV